MEKTIRRGDVLKLSLDDGSFFVGTFECWEKGGARHALIAAGGFHPDEKKYSPITSYNYLSVHSHPERSFFTVGEGSVIGYEVIGRVEHQ